eukprot:TRINITY_DN97437_c0_g1_i1.p2 TRINITY_DN97437_c0_g1~~TRINITY_DN97437_c0_g1_i1.p2  ORF type:complete len:114 (+),score=0.55 TRINITY_DN97437_c0_g1_i1:124-465(+)
MTYEYYGNISAFPQKFQVQISDLQILHNSSKTASVVDGYPLGFGTYSNILFYCKIYQYFNIYQSCEQFRKKSKISIGFSTRTTLSHGTHSSSKFLIQYSLFLKMLNEQLKVVN